MSEIKWYKLTEKTPEDGERYLLCDNRGSVGIGYWCNEREITLYKNSKNEDKRKRKAGFYNTRGDGAAALIACFWAELPEIPAQVKDKAKEEAIKRKIETLQKQLADLRAEAIARECPEDY